MTVYLGIVGLPVMDAEAGTIETTKIGDFARRRAPTGNIMSA
jgi:hypothetical protein